MRYLDRWHAPVRVRAQYRPPQETAPRRGFRRFGRTPRYQRATNLHGARSDPPAAQLLARRVRSAVATDVIVPASGGDTRGQGGPNAVLQSPPREEHAARSDPRYADSGHAVRSRPAAFTWRRKPAISGAFLSRVRKDSSGDRALRRKIRLDAANRAVWLYGGVCQRSART
jgi:hypothetical protein